MSVGGLSREEVLGELGRLKERLAAEYGVTRIGIFGSVARGEAGRGSDVDVVVEMAPDLYLRAELRDFLESRLGRRVDVIRYRDGMNAALRRRIDRDVCYV